MHDSFLLSGGHCLDLPRTRGQKIRAYAVPEVNLLGQRETKVGGVDLESTWKLTSTPGDMCLWGFNLMAHICGGTKESMRKNVCVSLGEGFMKER